MHKILEDRRPERGRRLMTIYFAGISHSAKAVAVPVFERQGII